LERVTAPFGFKKGSIGMDDSALVLHQVLIVEADPQHIKAIIELGGNTENQNFVALLGREVVGYFWGQVGDGPVYYLKDGEMYLDYIRVDRQREGYGKSIVKAIFDQLPVSIIRGETNDENKGFWSNLGSEFSSGYSDDIREVFEFQLCN
jgi:hypothetical protein